MFNAIIDSYSQFASMAEFKEAFFHSSSLTVIGTLIILEGLLSADNAIVLAIMVKHLPPNQRKKALMYGLVGAYAFRFIAIGIGVFLIKFKWVQVIGGGYLAYLALSHFFKNSQTDLSSPVKKTRGFWGTVMMLQLMDIAFSVDSVIAAFGISNNVWILLAGGLIGILMMRSVAQLFLKVIDTIPELETAAFALILVIGLKMLAGVMFDFQLSHTAFLGIVVLIFGVTFIAHFLKKRDN